MCLAVPAQLTECDGDDAVVDMHGNKVQVSTVLVPEAKEGDWVLVHAGFAIQLLDEDEAAETWKLIEDIAKTDEGGK